MQGVERILGAKYPISIGSAMIFESEEFDIKKWPRVFYINLRTLYRNFVASIPLNQYAKVNIDELLGEYLREVSEFERLVKEVSNNRVKTFFYYPHYEHVDKVLPHVTLKVYNPGEFDWIEEQIWNLAEQKKLVIPFFYNDVKRHLPPAKEPVLLLSSFVIDLLDAKYFPTLTLIESYTGKIKKRPEWYTKINVGKVKDLNKIKLPLCPFTIQVFGDKSGAYQGQDRNIRKIVREMAIKDYWSPVSTSEKIKSSIRRLKDTNLVKLLMSLL